MRQKFTYTYSWIVIIAIAILMNFAFTDGIKSAGTDTTYLHLLKSKSNIQFNIKLAEKNHHKKAIEFFKSLL